MSRIDALSVIGMAAVLIILLILVLLPRSNVSVFETKKAYSDVMTDIQEGLIKRGYEIEKIQPIDQGLAKAGYQMKTYRVIFFNPKADAQWVQRHYPKFTVFFPLTITLVKQQGRVKVINTPFKLLHKNAQSDELKQIVRKWEKESNEVIAAALRKDVLLRQSDNMEYSTFAFNYPR